MNECCFCWATHCQIGCVFLLFFSVFSHCASEVLGGLELISRWNVIFFLYRALYASLLFVFVFLYDSRLMMPPKKVCWNWNWNNGFVMACWRIQEI